MTTDQKGLDDPNALPSFAIPELSDRAPSTQKAEGTADTETGSGKGFQPVLAYCWPGCFVTVRLVEGE